MWWLATGAVSPMCVILYEYDNTIGRYRCVYISPLTPRPCPLHPGERNYHIFYEIFAALSSENRQAWHIPSLQDFNYVNSSGEYHRHDGERDIDNYCKLVDALGVVNVGQSQVEQIFGIVMSILHIGNLSFKQSTQAGEDVALFSDTCQHNVKAIELLLGISEEALYHAMTTRSIKVAGNTIDKKLNVEGATAARDVLAKSTYDLVFRSVLLAVNGALAVEDESEETASFIGVLDIFGFEYFQKNRWGSGQPCKCDCAFLLNVYISAFIYICL